MDVAVVIGNVLAYIYENYTAILVGLHSIAVFLAGLFLLVPGNQPEAFLKSAVAWLEKYSKK